MGLLGSIPFSISTPCLLVFKKVKKVLISGIPSKAKILVLVFGRGTSGTGLMIIVVPVSCYAIWNAEEGDHEPAIGEVIGVALSQFTKTPSLVFDRGR